MKTAACFDRDKLKDFALGNLTDEASARVESHLQVCAACEETVASFDDASDSLIRHLRAPLQKSLYEDDQRYQQALKRVQEIDLRDLGQSRRSANSESAGHLAQQQEGGVVLRDYRLQQLLGHGGMGAVYQALHMRLDMPVAVKLLPERRMRDAAAVARFQREMRAIGKLDSPAIVRATDAGEVDGTYFLVMELVEGVDLGRLVRRCGPLAVADACELIRQAAMGIEHAHQQGIIHRDLKPSNLMLTLASAGRPGAELSGDQPVRAARSPVPVVKILDLGLALLAGMHGSVDELTTVGQLMGTLDYMAPEQCGDSHEVDQRADVYGLAATLYKLICGEAPYGGARYKTPLQKLRALATTPAPRIEGRRADISPALADVIHRGLAAEPADRYASAAEFAAALAPFAAGSDLAGLWQTAQSTPDPEEEPPQLPDWAALNLSRAPAAAEDPAANEPGRGSAPRQRPSRARSRVGAAIAVLVIGVLLLAGILVYIETGKGKLMIECPRDDIAVTILRSGKFYDQLQLRAGLNTVRIGSGNYEIRLDGKMDSVEVKEGKFTLKRGQDWVARIVQQKQQSGAAEGATAATPQSALPLRYEGQTFDQWAIELKTERSPARQAKAIEALFELGRGRPKEAARTVLTALQMDDLDKRFKDDAHPSPQTILGLLHEKLGSIKRPVLLEVFNEALKRGTTTDRYVVLRYLYRRYFPNQVHQKLRELVPGILDATHDSNAGVRHYAVETVVSLFPQASGFRQRLAELMRDEAQEVAVAAATAMVFIDANYPQLAETLAKIAQTDTDAQRRGWALLGLHHLGPQAADVAGSLVQFVEADADEMRTRNIVLYPLPGEQNTDDWWSRTGFTYQGSIIYVSLQDLAIMTLGEIGPAAKSAVGALEREYRRRSELAPHGQMSRIAARLPADAIAKITGSRPSEPSRAQMSRTSGPVYMGISLSSWLRNIKGNPRSASALHAILHAIEVLAAETPKEQLAHAVDEWRQSVERERSPDQLAVNVQVLCTLAGEKFSREAAEAVIQAIRRRSIDLTVGETKDDQEELLVERAVAAVGKLDSSVVIPKLVEELETGNSTGRWFAMACLQKYVWADKSKRVDRDVRALLAASRDKHPRVRSSALGGMAIVAGNDPQVRARLKEALRDEDIGVVRTSAYSLAHVEPRNPELLALVERWAKSGNSDEFVTAVGCALSAGRKNEAYVEMLAKLLDDAAWGAPRKEKGIERWPRREAIGVLSALGPKAKRAVPALQKQLQHPNPQIRKAAAEALFRITGQRPEIENQSEPDPSRKSDN